MKILPLLCFLLLTACSTTPVPTGDRIVSVSWRNQGPSPYTLVDTRFCEDRASITLEELPGYTEKAMLLDLALTRNCKVSLVPVIGSRQLPRQTNWIPDPVRPTASREYHLQIRVLPNAPPLLKLEPVEVARQRIESAGRSFSEP